MKKTVLCLMLALVLVCAALPMTALAMPTDHDVSYRYVSTGNGGPLNLRASATKDSQAIASIPYGTQLMIYDYAPGDTWVLCIYCDKEGYVMTRYLSDSKPSYTKPSSSTPASQQESASDAIRAQFKAMQAASYYVTVTPSSPTGFVNFRWAPNKNEPVLETCYAGTTLRVLFQTNSWCQVYDESTGVCGYMMRKFLTYAGEVIQ